MDSITEISLKIYQYTLPVYLCAINLAALLMMLIDKKRAQKEKSRIPESTLFWVAIFGGSIGSVAGMRLFRHKTKHKSFVIGMPLILILQLAGAIALYILMR